MLTVKCGRKTDLVNFKIRELNFEPVHLENEPSQHWCLNLFLSCSPPWASMASHHGATLALSASGARRPPLCFSSKPLVTAALEAHCGGMCPPRAPCPATVSSYLCNSEQIVSAQLRAYLGSARISLGMAISPQSQPTPGHWEESQEAGPLLCVREGVFLKLIVTIEEGKKRTL